MWTYRQARRQGKRQDVWVWTAVVRELDGSRWAHFAIGDRSADTFLRLYERLPEAELYRTDGYRVYGRLPADRHQVGKGGAVNWNGGALVVSGEAEPHTSEDEGVHERRGYAEVFAGFVAGGLAL